MAKRIIGLDIGRDSLRAVEVENADGVRPTIVRFEQIELPDGAVRSGEVRDIGAVTSAIRKLWLKGGFSSKNVVVGMGNQRVLARDLTVPRAPIARIRESLPFLVQDMLPVPVADALLDFYPISEGSNETGPVVHGLLIAAVKKSVMANVAAVSQAGLRPVEVDLLPFALSRVVLRGPMANSTVAVVDIGASTTNVVIATNGIPQFVRMIPTGGDELTTALMTRLNINHHQAEAVKRTRGISSAPVSSDAERMAAEVIYQTVTELLTSLRNTINYFINSRANETVETIVLTGGGAQLKGLAEALGEMMGVRVVAADPFSTVDVSRKAAPAVLIAPHTMTIALGLALGSAA